MNVSISLIYLYLNNLSVYVCVCVCVYSHTIYNPKQVITKLLKNCMIMKSSQITLSSGFQQTSTC